MQNKIELYYTLSLRQKGESNNNQTAQQSNTEAVWFLLLQAVSYLADDQIQKV